MSDGLLRLLAAGAVVCAASAIKGAIGFGFPLVAVPLLSAILGPRVAIPVVAVPTLLSNVLVIRRVRGAEAVPDLWATLAGVALGTVAGALLLGSLDTRAVAGLVGVVALLYVIATATRLTLRVSPASVRRVGPVVGLAAGLMGGATGISSPLIAAYLHIRRLQKREFVYWITMSFFVVNIVQVATYARLGLYPRPVLTAALLACAPMIAGTLPGLMLQDRLDAPLFERIVLSIVFLASVNLVLRSLR